MATERSLERIGVERFDLLLLHNPDRIGYTSEAVWEGMQALRDGGLTSCSGVAPGPANGFTLDLIGCMERFGELIDWAMIILSPMEPWPGELVLDAAAGARRQADHTRRRLRRPVPRRRASRDTRSPSTTTASSAQTAGSRRAARSSSAMRPYAERHGLTMLQLACQWNLAHPAVRCVAPTLIQESGDERAGRSRTSAPSWPRCRGEHRCSAAPRWRETPRDRRQHAADDAEGRKSAEHAALPRPDRWPLDEGLRAVAARWSIDPERDLLTDGARDRRADEGEAMSIDERHQAGPADDVDGRRLPRRRAVRSGGCASCSSSGPAPAPA